MKRSTILAALALAAIAAVSTAAICGDEQELRRARTVDVEALSFEEVQLRALAAVEQPGQVYHQVATTESSQSEYTQDVWLDAAAKAARRQPREGETIDLQYAGGRAGLMEERFYDGPCEPCPEHEAAMSAQHLNWILGDTYKRRDIREGVVDGEPAIELRIVRQHGGETPGDDTAIIELDEAFLPLRMRVDPPGSHPVHETTFDNEFIPRTDLPADFFSPEALQALAGGPQDDVRRASEAGLDVWWLGPTFENVILRDESRFYPEGLSGDSKNELMLSYGPADPMLPAPCASIRIRPLGAPAPIGVPDGTTATDTVAIPGSGGVSEIAILYRATRVAPPIPPPHPADPGEDPEATPDPNVIPIVTAGADTFGLTPIAGDAGEFFAAVIETDDTVIEIATNCGPVGSNDYRTEAGFRRLVESLRLYAPPQ